MNDRSLAAVKPPEVDARLPTRERILDVAEALFAGRGVAGTSIRDIARGSGLTPASLYNHFESKDELYAAVLERGVRPLLDRMAGLADVPVLGPESVGSFITEVMEHLSQHPNVPRLVYLEAVTGGKHLEELAETWIRPMLLRGVAEMRRGSRWDEAQYPNVITAWLHLLFGYFALAPLLGAALDDDPLSPGSVDRQTRFLQQLVQLMMIDQSDPDSSTEGDP